MGLLFAIASSVLCSLVLGTLGMPVTSYWISCGCAGVVCGLISSRLFG